MVEDDEFEFEESVEDSDSEEEEDLLADVTPPPMDLPSYDDPVLPTPTPTPAPAPGAPASPLDLDADAFSDDNPESMTLPGIDSDVLLQAMSELPPEPSPRPAPPAASALGTARSLPVAPAPSRVTAGTPAPRPVAAPPRAPPPPVARTVPPSGSAPRPVPVPTTARVPLVNRPSVPPVKLGPLTPARRAPPPRAPAPLPPPVESAPIPMEDLGLMLSPVTSEIRMSDLAPGLPPAPAPAKPRVEAPLDQQDMDPQATENLVFSDGEIDLDAPVEPPSSYQHVKLLVTDPDQGYEGPLVKDLETLGFTLTVVETGQAARTELDAGDFPVCVLVTGQDAAWARMLMMAGQDSHPGVRFVVCAPVDDPDFLGALVEAGAADVFTPPYPSGDTLAARLHVVSPDAVPAPPGVPERVLVDLAAQRDMLLHGASLDDLPGAIPPAAPPPVAAPRPADPPPPAAAAPSLAAAQPLDDRPSRLEAEVEALRKQNAALEAQVAQAAGGEGSSDAVRGYIRTLEKKLEDQKAEVERLKNRRQGSDDDEAKPGTAGVSSLSGAYFEDSQEDEELRKLNLALCSLGGAVTEAAEYLTRWSAAGGSGAADMQKHVKTLRLLEKVIDRIATKVQE